MKERYKTIMRLKAVGFSQNEIARRTGLSQSQISRDTKRIRQLFARGKLDVKLSVRM